MKGSSKNYNTGGIKTSGNEESVNNFDIDYILTENALAVGT